MHELYLKKAVHSSPQLTIPSSNELPTSLRKKWVSSIHWFPLQKKTKKSLMATEVIRGRWRFIQKEDLGEPNPRRWHGGARLAGWAGLRALATEQHVRDQTHPGWPVWLFPVNLSARSLTEKIRNENNFHRWQENDYIKPIIQILNDKNLEGGDEKYQKVTPPGALVTLSPGGETGRGTSCPLGHVWNRAPDKEGSTSPRKDFLFIFKECFSLFKPSGGDFAVLWQKV